MDRNFFLIYFGVVYDKQIYLQALSFRHAGYHGLFWASCSEDSETVALYGVPCTQENGCCEMGDDCGEPSSSSEAALESSSSLADLGSSSSEDQPESSSSQDLSRIYPYRLASDTTVLCKDSTSHVWEMGSSTNSTDCYVIKSEMQKIQGKTEEEMLKLEERLDQCNEHVALYGVIQPVQATVSKIRHDYPCTNGKLYQFEKDGLVYTKEEFFAKFPSSSSAEPESSSSEGTSACERNDFIYKEIIDGELLYDMETAKQDSLGGDLQCDEPRPNKNYDGMIAKAIVCGGEESENPRYTQYVQTKKEEFDKYLASCKKKEVPSSSSANEGASSSSTEP